MKRTALKIWSFLTEPSEKLSFTEKRRARILLIMLVFIIPFAFIGELVYATQAYETPFDDPLFSVFLLMFPIMIASYILAKTRYNKVGSILFVVISVAAIYWASIDDLTISPYLIIPLLFSMILLDTKGVIGITLLITGLMATIPVVTDEYNIIELLAGSLPFFLICGFLTTMVSYHRGQLEKERTKVISQSEKLHRSILENTKEAVFVINKAGKITFWNNAAESIFGYTRDEIIERDYRNILGDDFSKYLEDRDLSQEPTENNKDDTLIIEAKTTSKKKIPLEITLSYWTGDKESEIIVIAEEYGERKKYYDKLEHDKTQYLKYLDESNVIFVVLNTKANIEYINGFGSDLIGEKKDELLGKNWFELIIPKHHLATVQKYFDKLVKEKVKFTTGVNPILDKNNTEKFVEWYNTTLFNDKGSVEGTLSVGIDITNQKEYLEQLETQKSELEKINKILVSRELKMMELKEQIKKLKKKS